MFFQVQTISRLMRTPATTAIIMKLGIMKLGIMKLGFDQIIMRL